MNNQQETPARGGNENAKDLMNALLGTFRDSKSMSKNRRAYLAWVESNGEREPELTPEEKLQISELVSGLSEPLKSTAYKAIEASFRQKKSL